MIALLIRAAAAALLLAGPLLACPARALEPEPDEEASLKTCEQSVCNIILKKEPQGKNPDCRIKKTWSQSTIKQGESKSVSWGFGDARCSANLEVDRGDIVAALTKPKFTLRVPTQTVKCQIVEDGELKPIIAKAAPKIKFKDGKADEVWINLESIQGPDNVTGTISTIAALEDKLGIFHKSMIKSINKFIHKRCAKLYGPDAPKTTADAGAKSKDAKPDKAKDKPEPPKKVTP